MWISISIHETKNKLRTFPHLFYRPYQGWSLDYVARVRYGLLNSQPSCIYALIKMVASIAPSPPHSQVLDCINIISLIVLARAVRPQKPHENNSRLDHYDLDTFLLSFSLGCKLLLQAVNQEILNKNKVDYKNQCIYNIQPSFPFLNAHQQPPVSTADAISIFPMDIFTSLSALWNTSNLIYWSVMLPATPPLFS